MGLEIERKWRVEHSVVEDMISKDALDIEEVKVISQAYLFKRPGVVMRVRGCHNTRANTHEHFLTIKGPSDVPGAVEECEMLISATLYGELIQDACTGVITKMRYLIPYGEFTIELDEFLNPELEGLWIAEVEFPASQTPFVAPDWFGEELTSNKAYSNAKLVDKINQ